jgi:hypothetical protein
MIHGRRHQAEGRKTENNGITFWWEADVEGKRHMASNEWMMRRREDHVDQRGEADG